MLRYAASQGFAPAVPVGPLSLDLHEPRYSYQVQVARAQRAVKRFREFENGPLTEETAGVLIDDFLVAAIEVRHIKDAVMKKEASNGKMSATLAAFLRGSVVQAVVADICNSAKHSGVDKTRHAPSPLRLHTQGDKSFNRDSSLADYYARMVLMAGTHHWRPEDLLAEALSEWNSYLIESGLVGKEIVEQLERT